MAIITAPAFDYDQFPDWQPVENVQVNRSSWVNNRRVLDLDQGSFTVTATVSAATENDVRDLRAFYADLRGSANRFRLPASRCQQVASDLTANGGEDAGVNAIDVSGANGLVLPKGIFATVVFATGVEQLVTLTAATTLSGSGTGTIQVQPSLRQALDNGAAIKVANPTGLVALVVGAQKPREADGIVTWVIEAEEAFDA